MHVNYLHVFLYFVLAKTIPCSLVNHIFFVSPVFSKIFVLTNVFAITPNGC